ncbi:MAG: ABC transporter ATP-binding protein [Tissierellaceae bacterium]|nr:ABC transporter ATP-binding protein [Tissierellaceae bacterium]
MGKIIEFKNFSLGFKDEEGKVYNLLDNVNFHIDEGVALGIVGESGCGKSMLSLSILKLLNPSVTIEGGDILYRGESIISKNSSEMESIRGKEISMIFQEPMTALNPVYTIGQQVGEPLSIHYPKMNKKDIRDKVIMQLDAVGIPNPETRYDQYPHQFSGGMRQRAMIAMAVICNPDLLVADEPTTALDVTIQAQVIEVMKEMKKDGSLLLVTHNLGVVSELCNEIVVMYAGCVVEKGSLKEVFDNPLHPYTKGLMAAVPSLDFKGDELYTIPGTVPTVQNFEKGCRFSPRCEFSTVKCSENKPKTIKVGENHYVQCSLYDNNEEA